MVHLVKVTRIRSKLSLAKILTWVLSTPRVVSILLVIGALTYLHLGTRTIRGCRIIQEWSTRSLQCKRRWTKGRAAMNQTEKSRRSRFTVQIMSLSASLHHSLPKPQSSLQTSEKRRNGSVPEAQRLQMLGLAGT